MGKKNKPLKPVGKENISSVPLGPLLSRRGKMTIVSGIGVAALGFWLLTFTDPAGQNWASRLCPFVILGGYALIGIGIVLPDPETAPPSSPNPSK